MQLPPLKFSALKIPTVSGAPNANFCFLLQEETLKPLLLFLD